MNLKADLGTTVPLPRKLQYLLKHNHLSAASTWHIVCRGSQHLKHVCLGTE